MRAPAANRRRSTRNRRNARAAANPRTTLVFSPKLKYSESVENADGMFMLSKRKRRAPTPEEIEAKKARQLGIKQRKYCVVALRHKVINMWLHGANFNEFQFAAGQARKIIEFLQASYPKYEKFATARSFVYRTIKRYKDADPLPAADPFRDLRGENSPRIKRNNPQIVQLVDELFSEPQATAGKVKAGLSRNGFEVSLSTIYRIAQDLQIRWTKPWHTDILTPAQKLKRKLFCSKLLRLTDEALLQKICEWTFTDEKWWDLVGPAAYKWCKGETKMDRKLKNQVCLFMFVLHALFIVLSCFFIVTHTHHRSRATKAKRAA